MRRERTAAPHGEFHERKRLGILCLAMLDTPCEGPYEWHPGRRHPWGRALSAVEVRTRCKRPGEPLKRQAEQEPVSCQLWR